jgi:8-oxo-dGTP pyrophosphatase MutT (NUDIX family)
MDGYYSVPAGGVEAGETIRAAALREASEEVGVEIRPENLEYCLLLHCLSESDEWIGHFFVASVWSGEPRALEASKHSHCRWSSLEEIKNHLIPYVRAALEGLESGVTYVEYGW